MARFSNWHDDGGGHNPPPCPHCSEPVRTRDSPRNPMFPGVHNAPWNAGWNGTCEACGARIELRHVGVGSYTVSEHGYSGVGIGGPAPPGGPESCVGAPDERPASERLESRGPLRVLEVRAASIPIKTFIDEGIVLAGVELSVTHQEFLDQTPTVTTLKLSLDEIEVLVRALDRELAPLREQWSWGVDDT